MPAACTTYSASAIRRPTSSVSRKLSACSAMRARDPSLDPLHRQEQLAGRREPVADVTDDRRVLEPRQDPRFSEESTRISGLVENLDRARDAVPLVERAVDDAHSPAPELLLQEKALSESFSEQGRKVSSDPLERK